MTRPILMIAISAATLIAPALAAPPGAGASKSGAASGIEIHADKNAPRVAGHPLTSVVVTQCNLIVAVYMTMADGRLLRFDSKTEVAADALVSMAYTAGRSERVEVSCNGLGPSGFETHEPT